MKNCRRLIMYVCCFGLMPLELAAIDLPARSERNCWEVLDHASRSMKSVDDARFLHGLVDSFKLDSQHFSIDKIEQALQPGHFEDLESLKAFLEGLESFVRDSRFPDERRRQIFSAVAERVFQDLAKNAEDGEFLAVAGIFSSMLENEFLQDEALLSMEEIHAWSDSLLSMWRSEDRGELPSQIIVSILKSGLLEVSLWSKPEKLQGILEWLADRESGFRNRRNHLAAELGEILSGSLMRVLPNDQMELWIEMLDQALAERFAFEALRFEEDLEQLESEISLLEEDLLSRSASFSSYHSFRLDEFKEKEKSRSLRSGLRWNAQSSSQIEELVHRLKIIREFLDRESRESLDDLEIEESLDSLFEALAGLREDLLQQSDVSYSIANSLSILAEKRYVGERIEKNHKEVLPLVLDFRYQLSRLSRRVQQELEDLRQGSQREASFYPSAEPESLLPLKDFKTLYAELMKFSLEELNPAQLEAVIRLFEQLRLQAEDLSGSLFEIAYSEHMPPSQVEAWKDSANEFSRLGRSIQQLEWRLAARFVEEGRSLEFVQLSQQLHERGLGWNSFSYEKKKKWLEGNSLDSLREELEAFWRRGFEPIFWKTAPLPELSGRALDDLGSYREAYQGHWEELIRQESQLLGLVADQSLEPEFRFVVYKSLVEHWLPYRLEQKERLRVLVARTQRLSDSELWKAINRSASSSSLPIRRLLLLGRPSGTQDFENRQAWLEQQGFGEAALRLIPLDRIRSSRLHQPGLGFENYQGILTGLLRASRD